MLLLTCENATPELVFPVTFSAWRLNFFVSLLKVNVRISVSDCSTSSLLLTPQDPETPVSLVDLKFISSYLSPWKPIRRPNSAKRQVLLSFWSLYFPVVGGGRVGVGVVVDGVVVEVEVVFGAAELVV